MIEIKNLNLRFDRFSLKNINLKIKKGEFYIILGPSGAGKTLILDSIGGFIKSENDGIFINNQNVNNYKPENRNLSICYQEFSLFPHMTVKDNILYGFRFKKKIKENEELYNELIKILNIEKLLNRFPTSLSGGEKQRVSLMRALVVKPEILLLDEPLSALDTQIKEKLIRDIKKIHKKYNITVLMITHSFEEAFYLGDKVSVINNGEIVQTGSMKEILHFPKNSFIANFVGMKNIFKGKYLKLDHDKYIGIRPESVFIGRKELECDLTKEGEVIEISIMNMYIELIVKISFGIIISYIPFNEQMKENFEVNEKIYVGINIEDISILEDFIADKKAKSTY
ncbi:ABC transporter ATP-binding protein [Helicovermis profundi]|uniref:Tungstate ABC transporter ATP-binding protein WtpC n=1 Tax=Helicovermis profundi TaxID=3065157 RepID=A0AAU9E6Q5_9FIRM|nr:tungstate ABC transporter ATP-binding protein WtpC [Clostridia bacterium S502]